MSFGQDIAAFVASMVQTDGLFGSSLCWRHITRAENPATGAVVLTTAEQVFRGAVVDPLRTRLFGESTLAGAATAVVVPAGVLPWSPSLLDEVEVSTGRWLRVVDIKELLGPGDTGSPVPIATVAALGVS